MAIVRHDNHVIEWPPVGAVADDVKATYGNGVLEVRIPCPEKAEPIPTKVPATRT